MTDSLQHRQVRFASISREDAHFARAPQGFFETWNRGAQISGAIWFGDGTAEGLQRATSKGDLRPDTQRLSQDPDN